MIRFVNHPAGLLLLRFDQQDIEAIKPQSPLIHHYLVDAFVQADVMTSDNGATKALKIVITPQFSDARTLCRGQEPGTFELECSGHAVSRQGEDGILIENLRASVEFGSLVIKELKSSRRETFTPWRTNSTPPHLIADKLGESAISEDELVLSLPALAPATVRSTLEQLVQDGYVVREGKVLRLDKPLPVEAPEDEDEDAPAWPVRGPTARQKIRAVFAAHDRDTSLSAEALVEETGLPPKKVAQVLKREVLNLRLFQEGKAYRLPSHAVRTYLNDRIAEVLALSTTQFKIQGLNAAKIKRELEEFAPAWIDRALENMVVRHQISQQGEFYIFNNPDMHNRGSGLNRIRAVLKEAGEAGLTPRQALDLLPEVKPAFIHWNLQQLAIRGLARFESDRFYWIGAKPAAPRVTFRDELLAFMRDYGGDAVPREAVHQHFSELPRIKVTVGLNDLQNRGYVIFRNNAYRLRERATSDANASANATP